MRGALNPKNAAPDTGGSGFKEGFVRVDKSVFKVHQGKSAEGGPAANIVTALAWGVTRLNENLEVLTNEHDEPMTEVLTFPLGGKSLVGVHPGKGDGPEDEEPEDLGTELNTEGNTLYFTNADFKVHPKASAMVLMNSVLKQKPDLESIIDRQWAPDYEGAVVYMKTWIDADMKQKYTDKKTGEEKESAGIPYKIVDKVVVAPGAGKKAKGAAAGGNGATGGGENEKILITALKAISEKSTGSCTLKSLVSKLNGELQTSKVNPKLHVTIQGMIKPEGGNWFGTEGNPAKVGMTWDAEDRSISFGEAE